MTQAALPSDHEASGLGFGATVARLARALAGAEQGELSRGDVAALRREDGALSPTFYKLAATVLHDELLALPSEELLCEAERRWARVVHLLARTGGQHRSGALRLGKALAEAGLSEARFVRLVRAEGDALDAAGRAAIAPLAAKAITFDPLDLAKLVLSTPHASGWCFHSEPGDQVRRRVARDFYAAAPSSKDSPSSK
jgi:CRISPR system Cascade subunit CasB